MIVVGPGYLNERSLPYASDVFYHERLLYFLPTGFHPIELNSVASFPEYCKAHAVSMPKFIWTMCDLYFQNSKSARSCIDILEPLHKQHIVIAMASYPRDRTAIDTAQAQLHDNPQLRSTFSIIDLDSRLLSREILSHVLFEIFIDEGYRGTFEYLRANAGSPEQLINLAAATLLNRLKIFTGETKLLVYEHSWYPFMQAAFPLLAGHDFLEDDAQKIEHFRFKLFETILLPIFGKCDSKRKSELVAQTARKYAKAIVGLKDECESIAREVVLLSTKSQALQQKVLSEGIERRIAEPLADLIRKPKRDILNLLRDFTLDSTVIGGLLAATQGASGSALPMSIAAGAISSWMKYLISKEQRRMEQPSELLLDGMRKARITEDSVQKHLQSISIPILRIPEDWGQIA